MPDSTLAGLTALGGLTLAIAVLIPNLRRTKATELAVKATGEAVKEVHTMVNQQRTDAQRYQIALIKALTKAGVEVPQDQSLNVPPYAKSDPEI